MNKQLQFLLDILLSGLYGKVFEKSCEDWESLYALAKVHSVGNIFYKAIQGRSDVSNELKQKAKKQYLGNIHQQILQDYYAEQIFNELNKHNIPYMPLKGYYLRKLYPVPELRTSCDVDFFYDSTHTEELNKIMQAKSIKPINIIGQNHKLTNSEKASWKKSLTLVIISLPVAPN